jgi:hypothetical protein
LALQLLALAGAPLADARTEAAAASPGRHVESERAAACPVHDHQVCQLCRTLRTFSLPAAPVLAPSRETPVFTAAAVLHDSRPQRRVDPSRSARAPPLS